MAEWKQKRPVAQILRSLPPQVLAEATARLDTNVDKLVEAEKRACPVGVDLEKTPGELRDSIKQKASKTRSGAPARTVYADAKDAHGNQYGLHVEVGHRSKDGHVPAHPFWFSTYRAWKPGFRRDVINAGKAVVQRVALGLTG